MIHLFFLGVIHKIFQAHLGASYQSMPKAKLAVEVVQKSYVRMQPTAIALNYSVKDIRHNIQQIIYTNNNNNNNIMKNHN